MKAEDYFLTWMEDVAIKTDPFPNVCDCFCCNKFNHHEAMALHKPTGIMAICVQKIREMGPYGSYSQLKDPVYLAEQDLRRKIKLYCDEQEKMTQEEINKNQSELRKTLTERTNKLFDLLECFPDNEDAFFAKMNLRRFLEMANESIDRMNNREKMKDEKDARVEYTERMNTPEDKICGQMAVSKEYVLNREKSAIYRNPLSYSTIDEINQLKELSDRLSDFLSRYYLHDDAGVRIQMAIDSLRECVAFAIQAFMDKNC